MHACPLGGMITKTPIQSDKLDIVGVQSSEAQSTPLDHKAICKNQYYDLLPPQRSYQKCGIIYYSKKFKYLR